MDVNIFLMVIGATLFSGVLGLSGGVILLLSKKFAEKISMVLVSFAAGSLLAAAFFDLMPETFKEAGASMLPFVLLGLCIFYLLEKFVIWHHCHDAHCEHKKLTYSVIIGDSLHNFIDGALIASTFLINVQLGVLTTAAVLIHEIPQEIGDFGILLNTKMKRSKIFFYNFVSALVSVLGAILTFFFLEYIQAFVPYVAAIAAGGFIYIATADLIPETHKEPTHLKTVLHTAVFFAGMAMMWLLGAWLGV
jgi:zinc and cadmium transporter